MGNPIITNEPDAYYDEDDYDLFGNLIHHEINYIKMKVLKKMESVENTMFTIQTIDYYRSRPSNAPTNIVSTFECESLFFVDIDFKLIENICTKII